MKLTNVCYYRFIFKIYFQTYVVKVKKADNFEETGQWIVTTKEITSQRERTEKYDFILACNGHLTEPNIPSVPGLETFKGKVLHSHDYRDFRGFEKKRLLVVGNGSSATDVACELSQHASQVHCVYYSHYIITKTCLYNFGPLKTTFI